MLKNIMKKVAAVSAVVLGAVSGSALAVAPDYTSLTDQIDLSTTSAALLVAAGALIGVYILWKGARMIVGAFKG